MRPGYNGTFNLYLAAADQSVLFRYVPFLLLGKLLSQSPVRGRHRPASLARFLVSPSASKTSTSSLCNLSSTFRARILLVVPASSAARSASSPVSTASSARAAGEMRRLASLTAVP